MIVFARQDKISKSGHVSVSFGFQEQYLQDASARGRKQYSTSLDEPGGVLLRPWMLGFRCDFGLPGLQEPEETERLMELILTETFRADSDLPGVEKVAVTIPDSSWLEKAYTPLPPLPGYGGLVHNRLSIDPAFYMWPASNGGGGAPKANANH